MILILLNKRSYAIKKGYKDNKQRAVINSLTDQFDYDFEIKYFKDLKENNKYNIIIPMGAKVANRVLGTSNEKITKLRLNYYKSKKYDAHILPTFAPGYVFTKTDSLIDIQQDFERIELIGKDFPLEPEYYVFEDAKYCASCINTINNNKKYKLLTCDIEASGLDWKNDWITELGITHKENKSLIIPHKLLENKLVQQALKKLFSNQNKKFLWQNGKFDSKFLIYNYKYPVRQDEDTILQHYALDERQGTHNFTRLSQLYLNAKDYEAEFKALIPKGGSYADAPDDARREYLAKDTAYLWLLHKIFNSKMDKNDKYLYDTILKPTSNLLTKVEMNGIKIDQKHLKKLDIKMSAEIKELLSEIRKVTDNIGWTPEGYKERSGAKSIPEKFNPNSNQQSFDIIFNLLKLPKHNDRKSADATARDYWLNKVCEKGTNAYKLISKLSEFKKVKKLHSTYVKGLKKHIKAEGRVYTDFLLFGTVTGRLSSKSPNVQNVARRKDIKNLFTVDKGNVMVEVDFSQAELRVIAYLSDDENMKEVYQKGSDLHDEVAIDIFGEDFTSEQRTFCKSINFG